MLIQSNTQNQECDEHPKGGRANELVARFDRPKFVGGSFDFFLFFFAIPRDRILVGVDQLH